MNSTHNNPTDVETHPMNAGEPPGGPASGAATSSTSTNPTQNHDGPPCDCWHNLKDKGDHGRPVPLNLVLPPVRTELGRAIRALNSIITLVNERVVAEHEHEDMAGVLPPDVLEAFSAQRETVANCFETVSVIITTTPGYVCKQGNAEHERSYSKQLKTLTDFEDQFTRNIEAAEPLLKARDELVLEERRLRRRKYIQTSIRAMSIVIIPYSPLLSAILTAVDVYGISVDIAVQRLVLPDVEEAEVTLATAVSLDKSVQEMRRLREEAKRIREELEAVRAKLEEAQQRPIAAHLAGILYKSHLARQAVESVLSPVCNDFSSSPATVHIQDVIASLQDMADALEMPDMVVGPLALLSEDRAACLAVDKALAVLRASSPATEQAGSMSSD